MTTINSGHHRQKNLLKSYEEESYAYLDVLPEWIGRADGDHPNFVDHSKWHSVGKPRASLRLDLNPAEEEIFAIFEDCTV